MSGKKTNFRTWNNPKTFKGEFNDEASATMPDMHTDPRTVLENHVRGINPITGAVLDRQHYYGDAIIPYGKDLTFEELRIKRAALEQQLADAIQAENDAKITETVSTEESGTNGTAEGTEV